MHPRSFFRCSCRGRDRQPIFVAGYGTAGQARFHLTPGPCPSALEGPPKNPGGPPVGALRGRRGEAPGAGPPGRCTGRRGEPWRAPRGAPGVVLNSCRLTPPLRGGHAVRAQGRPRRNAAGGSEVQQRGRPGPELPAPVSPSPPCLSRHESGAKCKSKNLALALLKTYLPACRY